MAMDDFQQYPMKEAMQYCFQKTKNVMLKLPKNSDIPLLLKEIAECYLKANP